MPGPILRSVYETRLPQPNKDIMNGLSRIWLDRGPKFLESIIIDNMKNVHPSLEYIGHEMCDAEELHNFYKRMNNSNPQVNNYEKAKSTLALYKYLFRYNGVDLDTLYLLLPYAEDGDIITLTGTEYHATPILSTGVITPEANSIFVRLLKDKFLVHRLSYQVKKNDIIYKNAEIIYSKYLNAVSGRRSKAPYIPIVFYTLARYGLTKTLKYLLGDGATFKFVKTDLTDDDKMLRYDKYYNEYLKYKEDDRYDIIESVGIIPPKFTGSFNRHNIGIVIDKDNKDAFKLAYNIIYLFDYVPEVPTFICDIFDEDSINERLKYTGIDDKDIDFWINAISYLTNIEKDGDIAVIYRETSEFINNLDTYMNDLIKRRLAEVDIYVDDVYQLFLILMSKFSEMVLNYKTYMNDMSKRYLDILYYVYYEFIEAFNRTISNFQKKIQQNPNLSYKEVNNLFKPNGGQKVMNSKTIYGLVSGQGGLALALSVIDICNDNKYIRAAGLIELQERGEGVKRPSNQKGKKTPKIELSPDDLVVGNLLNLSKSFPSATTTLNPFSIIDLDTGRIIIKEELKETLKLMKEIFAITPYEELDENDENLEVELEWLKSM